MTNNSDTVLYTGVTSNLIKRVYEHRANIFDGFTKKYNIIKLVYLEVFDDIGLAFTREKQIKAGSRRKKMDLITKSNPDWKDLLETII